MSSRRLLAAILLLATLAGVVRARAVPLDTAQPLTMAEAGPIMAMIDQDARLASVFAMCPADAFRRDAAFYALYVKPDAEPAACGADPLACYRRCAADGRPGACFSLARRLEETSSISNRYPQTLFALACDAGMGAGCTNRAASLRNSPVEGEPLLARSHDEQAACEQQSFAIACRQGEAWGCAMLGQAFEEGEGVAKDVRSARSAFDRSCAIAPEFAACAFAKRHAKALETPAD